ncbi:hypothetical protein MMC28_005195 [Mycoblastus sanguinarius]|nr:hypothetical protein [Mycoblastus sanguinarius]
MSTPAPTEIAFQKAHIHDDQRIEMAVVIAVCLAVAYTAVFLRYVSRRLAGTKFGKDDGWVCAALVSQTLYSTAYSVMIHYGFGRHSILVTNIKGLVVSTTITAIGYNTSVSTVKISILCLYRRIFPQRWLKYALLAVAFFAAGQYISFNLVTILSCVPISAQWSSTVKARCVNYAAASLVSGILNVLTDITILTLPMPIVWRLQISNYQKRLTTVTFLLDGLVCIISIIRLAYIRNWGGEDSSYNNVHTTELSLVEVSIGTLSSCLPIYRPLYNYYFHGEATANTTSSRSKGKGAGSGDQAPIKMTSMRRQWNEHAATRGNDDEERLYNHFGTVTRAEANGENMEQHNRRGKDIVVTKKFTTSSSSSR